MLGFKFVMTKQPKTNRALLALALVEFDENLPNKIIEAGAAKWYCTGEMKVLDILPLDRTRRCATCTSIIAHRKAHDSLCNTKEAFAEEKPYLFIEPGHPYRRTLCEYDNTTHYCYRRNRHYATYTSFDDSVGFHIFTKLQARNVMLSYDDLFVRMFRFGRQDLSMQALFDTMDALTINRDRT